MRHLFASASALLLAGVLATTANAAVVVVTPTDMQGWSNPVGENSGGGHSEISPASPLSGDGSLALSGDRTRFVLGSLYSSASNLGLFSEFTNLAFEYRIDPASVSACCGDKYSPALRMIVWNGSTKEDFVFEQAYQTGGLAAAGPIGTWNSTSAASTFYRRSLNNENNQKTLADWSAQLSPGAYVGAVYVGAGGGIGPAYRAYADNVVAGGSTYNFEVSGIGAAVPEPATWGLMILGFGAAGAMLRRRRPAVAG